MCQSGPISSLVVWLILAAPLFAQQTGGTLKPADLLSAKTIEALELSPDGQQIVYVIKEPDWKQNRFVKSLWLVAANALATPVRLTDNENDDAPQWSPDGSRIAFLSAGEGAPQVWTQVKPEERPERLTDAAGGVVSFAWAPDGHHIAFIARNGKKGGFEAAQDKDTGIVINKWDFVIYKLLNNSMFLQLDQRNELWLADITSKAAEPLINDVHVTQFAWSPDGRHIAPVFQSLPGVSTQRADVLIYSLADKRSDVVLRGTGGQDYDDTSGYSNPIWSPDSASLALFLTPMAKRWQAKPVLGLYTFTSSNFAPLPGADRLVLFRPKFTWLSGNHMLLENTSRASRQLLSFSLQNGELVPVGEHRGSEGHFSFARNGETAAFVRESSMNAPEIYLARAPFTSATRLTSLNRPLHDTALPKFERVHWKSSDGAEVEGWLGKPPAFQPDRKYPLLVMVHGGPAAVVPDEFEMYFEWPYPYRLAAMRGYLVLLPNYRGTGSYSMAFSAPRDLAGEPVDDIVAGIDSLVRQGFVDEQRIGIAGHSHGAWLGPQVLTTNPKKFRAASFAEGSADLISNYGLMPGWLNLNIHDYYWGGPPFASPRRYLATSPIFHVAGLTTPTLLEFGEQSQAVLGMEFQSALWRCGVPSELVIYPKTGHNMSRPAQEAESMERNLDWFGYWMLGEKDPSPQKQEEYRRWEQTARDMQTMRQTHPCTTEAASR